MMQIRTLVSLEYGMSVLSFESFLFRLNTFFI